MIRVAYMADDIEGKDPEPSPPNEHNLAGRIFTKTRMVLTSPVTLVPTGPLTNQEGTMSILIEPTMDDRIHPGSAVKPSDKEHGVTTDSHWTENYQFSPTMRIRDKTTKPDPAGYATRSWKRDHPEFFMESQARRNAGRPARKRIVKAH